VAAPPQPSDGPAAPPGLRERKRLRTRREISDVATRLFVERGFERVTLAEIAEAAEVSVKTIFNHFGAKEELFFDRVDEVRARFESAVTERPPGVTVLGALRALLTEHLVPIGDLPPWSALENAGRYEMFRGFQEAQDRSPALRARRALIGDETGESLRGVFASELGRDADEPAIRTLTVMVSAALELRDKTLRAAVLERLPAGEVRRRVVAVVEESFGRLEKAFADLDRPAV
jgi:AcrR family transcriptional regulator